MFKISHSMKNKEVGYYNKIKYPHFYVRRQHVDFHINQSSWYDNLKVFTSVVRSIVSLCIMTAVGLKWILSFVIDFGYILCQL